MWFGRDQVKRATDSVMAIGPNEVGGVGEESNVTNPDEYTNEVHCVVCRITAVEFDPKLL